jgi:hypothetical protein
MYVSQSAEHLRNVLVLIHVLGCRRRGNEGIDCVWDGAKRKE